MQQVLHLFNHQGGPAKVRPTYIFYGNRATFIKTGSYSQKYYYKLKANKYQQNYKQTILP